MTEDLAFVILRITLGLLLMGHGTQKLFGWFGGYGPEGTAGYFASLRVREPGFTAYLVGAAELGGGTLLALGFLTPLAGAAILSVMLGAMFLAHWPKIWVTEGGFEYPLVNIAVVTFFGLAGPGGWSFDAVIGTEDVLPNPWTYVFAACAAIISVGATLATREVTEEEKQGRAGGGSLASQGR
jgi:putative oxidoreductase